MKARQLSSVALVAMVMATIPGCGEKPETKDPVASPELRRSGQGAGPRATRGASREVPTTRAVQT
jgi:hypothetical protein